MGEETDSVQVPPLPTMENGESGKVNGVSDVAEGHSTHHKSDHKDKHRDKEKDRHRSDKDRDHDKHRHSSKSSHKDKHREKDRHRDEKKDRDKDHKSSSHSSSKDKERSKDHHSSSSSRDKEKHHSSSSSRDKEKHRSDKERSDKDRERSEKDKDRERSDKDKDRERSDKDKDRERSDREKDRDRSNKDRDRHHSSGHRDKGDKHSSSSSSRDKDKHRSDKDRHSSSHKSKEHRDKEHDSNKKREEIIPKEEPVVKKEAVTEESADDSAAEEPMQIEVKEEPEEQASQGEEGEDEEEETEENSQNETQEESEDEKPLALRDVKRELSDDEEEDTPLFARIKKMKKEDGGRKSAKKNKKRKRGDSSDEEDFKPAKKKPVKKEAPTTPRKAKKEEEQQEVWKWWEEEKLEDGNKWRFLEHKGPLFAPEYEPLPNNVKFYYSGKEMKLSQDAEEVATFYAKMLEHDYTSKEAFNTNFFKDWRKTMTEKEKAIIKDLSKCDFRDMNKYFTEKSEERKNRSKEEKKAEKLKNDEITKIYGFCKIDGHKEKIGNFRIEPPGLFRGRGEHPKMGMHKHRVMPEDVIINCSKDSETPKPPSGHKWKKVQYDPKVTWLASWTENVQGNVKYVMLNPSSKLKGEKDMVKYEMARKLCKKIDKIRQTYQEDWKSKEMRIRQRAVALYFIDRLALRAGNEKDEDQADTVGCCSLRVEHVELKDELNGKEFVVIFDFLGKDSIRYYNEVPVEKRVYKNLKLFMENKKPGDDLFDRLNTAVLNKHLNELMDGLTAKVFRTYNASYTLQKELEKTNPDDSVAEKILAYNRANRQVAILCNHQRAVPKTHEKSMETLKSKIDAKREDVEEAKSELKSAKRNGDSSGQEKAKKKLARLKEQLMKLELQETDKEENKTIALGTSKLNYLDPRISVAWCKKHDVPIEKIYTKTHRDKFRWAIEMAGPDYVF